MWKKVAIGFGILVGIASIVTLIILTSGAAAAIAAGTAKTVSIAGTSFVTAHLIGAGIGVGAATVLCGGGLAYGYYIKPDKMAENIEKITNMLTGYLQTA
eukprot:98588_1